MKQYLHILASLMCCFSTQTGVQATEFSNLDFEDVIQPLEYVMDVRVPLTNALPGWSQYVGGAPYDLVVYNDLSLGGAAISLQGPGSLEPILQGAYTVRMQGSSYILGNTISIEQTGQVPIDSKSLQFWALNLGGIEVSFNKHLLPYSPIENGANYTVYGVDISQYAGQTGELMFAAPPQTGATIDNIQFSSEAIVVPEPGTVALFALGAFAMVGRFAWRRIHACNGVDNVTFGL